MENHGEDKVREYWVEHGNRKTAKHFGVPPATIDHCKIKFRWKRPMENAPHILKGIARGKAKPSDYPHLDFKVPKSLSVLQKNDIKKHAYYLLKKGTFIG